VRAVIPEPMIIKFLDDVAAGKIKPQQPSPSEPRYEPAEVPTVPVRPDGNEVLGYLESCGYKAEQFQVWEDENEQKVIIKPIKYMGTDKWRNEMNELGAIYVKENKTYEVNM